MGEHPCENCRVNGRAAVPVHFGDGGQVFQFCPPCAGEAVGRGCAFAESDPDSDEDGELAVATWLVLWTADGIVEDQARVVLAMRAMTTPVLQSLKWMLHDDYWPLLHDEMAGRGEDL